MDFTNTIPILVLYPKHTGMMPKICRCWYGVKKVTIPKWGPILVWWCLHVYGYILRMGTHIYNNKTLLISPGMWWTPRVIYTHVLLNFKGNEFFTLFSISTTKWHYRSIWCCRHLLRIFSLSMHIFLHSSGVSN